MKSLEDLEKALERGLNAWENEIVGKQAQQMGLKIVREVKRNTPHISGNLKRRWSSRAEKQEKDIKIYIENDADYAAYVNNGHRIVSGGKTVGFKEGKHMLEEGIASYQNNYMKDDVEQMFNRLKRSMN